MSTSGATIAQAEWPIYPNTKRKKSTATALAENSPPDGGCEDLGPVFFCAGRLRLAGGG